MQKLAIGIAALSLLAVAMPASAQGWDTPAFMGPRPAADLGVYIVDNDPGALGVHGIWRQTASTNLGLRLGFTDAGDGVIHLGAETWGAIILEGADFPLDLSWTAGAGASINGVTTIAVPAGVSIGKTFDIDSVRMQLYGHPRFVLAAFNNPVDDNLEIDLDGQLDIGMDLYLSSSLTLKVAISSGPSDVLGLGLAWRQ